MLIYVLEYEPLKIIFESWKMFILKFSESYVYRRINYGILYSLGIWWKFVIIETKNSLFSKNVYI